MMTLMRELICAVQNGLNIFDRDQDEYVQILRDKYRESEVAEREIQRSTQPENQQKRRSIEDNWRPEKRHE